jgi:anti-sigma factor RsiW
MSRMDCGENEEALMAYAAGGLDQAGRANLERHLAECATCRELVGGQRAVWNALGAWDAPPVSADFDRRLYDRIEREVSWWDRALRPFRPALARQWLPIMAAACLLLAAGVVVHRSADVGPAPQKASAQLESLRPEQVEGALEDMELLQEFDGLVRPDSTGPAM